MKAHIENARNRANAIYNKRDRYKARAAPLAKQIWGFASDNVDKGLMIGLVIVEMMQADSLDNIEHASNVSAAVDYDNYTKG